MEEIRFRNRGNENAVKFLPFGYLKNA